MFFPHTFGCWAVSHIYKIEQDDYYAKKWLQNLYPIQSLDLSRVKLGQVE